MPKSSSNSLGLACVSPEAALSKAIKIEYEGKIVPAQELEFEAEKEPWTVYKLEDGTTIKFKQALAKICRLTENFKSDGEPIYVFQIGSMAHVDAPSELKKGPKA
jgi:hypothetical protein